MGFGSYGNPEVKQWPGERGATVGRFCSIADGVVIFCGGNHHADWVTTYPFPERYEGARAIVPASNVSRGGVVIDHDVWIGRDAVILSGVHIYSGAVIGARSVVTRDVGPYEVWAGNPARFRRRRFPPEQIAALLRIAWWNWTEAEIAEAWPLLLSEDVAAFIAKYDR